MTKLLRKLAAEQADNAFGDEAVQQLLGWIEITKPAATEIESWATRTRPFAARHGPQFEAATIGRFALRLIRHVEYVPLARRLAAEADKLFSEAGNAPQYAKLIAQWDEE